MQSSFLSLCRDAPHGGVPPELNFGECVTKLKTGGAIWPLTIWAATILETAPEKLQTAPAAVGNVAADFILLKAESDGRVDNIGVSHWWYDKFCSFLTTVYSLHWIPFIRPRLRTRRRRLTWTPAVRMRLSQGLELTMDVPLTFNI